MKYFILWTVGVLLLSGWCSADLGEGTVEEVTVDADLGASREALRTDTMPPPDPLALSAEQLAAVRARADSFTFQTEVNRMMKLIINSLYRNKEIFLRELISNASDALDKIRLMSLTDRAALASGSELAIRIRADPVARTLTIADSGVGMTRAQLVQHLGTIAKSGTADFLASVQDQPDQAGGDTNDMIGQFGVGFYSAFLVADRVVVTSKHNDDDQHVWESDATSFSVAPDPRGNTLQRGTQITLHLKEEAADFLQADTIKQLVQKYSQFINFPIYLWSSRQEEAPAAREEKEEEEGEGEEARVEEETTPEASATRTVWEWQLMNDNKPLWTRAPAAVQEHEYTTFYKALTKDSAAPLARAHFVAEGEVTFRALLFVPRVQPAESFNRYGTKTDHIKLYVRRVFITDEFNDLMPNYLAFIQGIVDSDDLPLNVSRETLQQHKLIKIIKKKLVRKVLDMLRRIPDEDYELFWKEYSTNIKLGVMEDPSNRSRLAKLLRFQSSRGAGLTSLGEYAARMAPGQEHIYYVAGAGREDAARAPFAERLVARRYEVLYLTEAVDEYCLSSLPEYDGHKFQNIAKEIFTLDEGPEAAEQLEALKKEFEPLTTWLGSQLDAYITKATVSRRLSSSPAALVATVFGWTGNMERLALSNAHQKSDDAQRKHHLSQKKVLEINPRHPLVLELLRRVQDSPSDEEASRAALTLYRTAALRSGYMLQAGAGVDLAASVERMLQVELGLDPLAAPEPEPLAPAAGGAGGDAAGGAGGDADRDADRDDDDHDEL